MTTAPTGTMLPRPLTTITRAPADTGTDIRGKMLRRPTVTDRTDPGARERTPLPRRRMGTDRTVMAEVPGRCRRNRNRTGTA